MKFRNPETGKEFSAIFLALMAECVKHRTCEGCPLQFSNNACMSCRVYAGNNPAETARRLGLEVIEDKKTCGDCEKNDGSCYASYPPQIKCTVTGRYHFYDHACDVEEDNMEKQDKPRLANILGLELGEKIKITMPEYGETDWFAMAADGTLRSVEDRMSVLSGMFLAYAINHPESVIRETRLTPKELALCKDLGARWVSRPISIGFGFDFKVFLWKEKPEQLAGDTVEQSWVAAVSVEIFPSVHPGDLIEVPEEVN